MNKITRDQAEKIFDALCDRTMTDRTFDEAVRFEYSGRNMFGKFCVGFILDTVGEVLALGMAFADVLPDEQAYWLAGDMAWDNMGRSYIAYFPGLQLADED